MNVLLSAATLDTPPRTYSRLPVQQSVCQSSNSTEAALVSVHNDPVRSIDNGKVSLLVLLDLSAAFDTVDHQLLLSVLANWFSAVSTAPTWFASYDRPNSNLHIQRWANNQSPSRLQRPPRLGPVSSLLCLLHRRYRRSVGATCRTVSLVYTPMTLSCTTAVALPIRSPMVKPFGRHVL